ncbi:formyl transferase [Marinifilum sp. N1E240]|uniref:formyl transferase n=1 Tax=Marinifilum sp. N1E240 TaxID=2608082 RepID=UPI001D046CDD|nr:formyl transferase [Marinifilum sp. N1E240]
MKILMLVGDGDSSKIVYNALENVFEISKIVEDTAVPKNIFLKRRIKKLGFIKVIGQILFSIYNKFILFGSSCRIEEIKRNYGLSVDNYPTDLFVKVDSINDNDTIKILIEEQPDVVIVNGTRIISKKVLSCTKAIFINTHTGITPEYRGVHGGYWALVNGDKGNCGVTVHMVDEGIDTGGVLYQDVIEVTSDDNFNTYPYLQIAKAVPLIKCALTDIQEKNIKFVHKDDVDSVIYSHPTFWEYIKYRSKGVK